MDRIYLRGDIYYANFGQSVGFEQERYCPVLIIQNDIDNRYSSTVVVAAITRKTNVNAKLPTYYFIDSKIRGLDFPSIVLLKQLWTLDKKRLTDYIGRLSKMQMRKINYALATSLGLTNNHTDKIEICLCQVCLQGFLDTGTYDIRRADLLQKNKSNCDFCNYRQGFDYVIQ